MSNQSDYSKLVEARVNTRVAAELCNTFKTGKLLYDDLDPRAIEAFRDCPINEAIALLKTFTTTTNLNHVKNKSAYLCGMMKTQRQKNQQGKGGKPQRGVSPGRQMNRGGPSQGPRGPNMGPPSRNQMPRMPPPLMPQPPGQRMAYGMPAPNPQLPPGPPLQQGPIGNQGYGQPGNQGCGPGNQGYGPGNQGYGPGNQGYGPGNQGYGPGNQGYGPGNQGYGPGNQGYGPGNQGYGSDNQGFGPGNQGYGSGNQGFGPGNQGFGPGNQGYGPGNQGYGPGNQGYGQGNQRYGEPGNQGYGNQGNMQPGNQGFGGPSGQGYMQPGNQGFGSFGNQGGNYHPGEGQGHGQQKPKDKNKKQKGKPKQGNNNQREEKLDKEIEDGDIPDVDDGEVFKFIIKTFGGGCTYDEFLKKCTLFPLDSNIPLWFRKHSRRFHIFWNPDDKSRKQIVYLQPFYRDAKVCNKYNNRKNPGNCDESCEYFHICRKFVRGNCRNKDCPLFHSFKNTHNKKQRHKLGISDFTDADIKVVLNCNSPSVCSDYAYDNVCKVPNSERRCPHLHLCRSQVFGKCSDPCKFKKTHSIEQFHNKWVLASCHMKDWPQQRVFKSIYVPPKPSLVVDDLSDESDLSQDEDDNNYQASNLYDSDSSESLSSTTSDRSRSMSNLRDSMNSLTMGYDAGSKKGQPPSRKNRFKSTENITGIVGRDVSIWRDCIV